ncbi:SIMPL domain-containing protein [Candidatus Gottesmanbacteria bacterium]|nr:SIMPL domain-containing protein [Candidatus Gottesmanbacteria bacterium]
MKQTLSLLVLFFLASFVFFKYVSPFPLSISLVSTQKTDSFAVSGEGKVSTSPDRAILNAGVTITSPTVKIAQQELNTKINAVSNSIKSLGIDAKDIKTSQYSLNPQYDYRDGTSRVTGYQASSNLVIAIKNLDRANDVLDAVVASGANVVGGLTFDVSDKTRFENEARKLAIDQARTKAQDAARLAGFSLGRMINYTENWGNQSPRPMYAAMDRAGVGAEATKTQIDPGSNEITVNVTLSYEIR